MSSFTINKIFFIISDDDNKRKEAFQTVSYNCLKHNFECELIEVNSKKDFSQAIKCIKNECLNNAIYPYIHLECHGSKKGIQLLSNATINWNDLSEYFSTINKACRNNLFISLATCFGGYLSLSLIRKLTQGRDIRAPFFGLIGPKDEVKYYEIENGFDAYFQQIIELKDIENGFTELQNKLEVSHEYAFRHCEEVFVEFIESFIELEVDRIHKSDISFNAHLTKLSKKYFNKYGFFPTRNEIETLAKVYSNKDYFINYFNKIRETYFMLDLYPENKYRFKKVHDIPNWNQMV